uniref:Uncharacterized protein n=1 Tax=Plectus sambesii TaxID=2011161 RepID=A0A914X895_9BILA
MASGQRPQNALPSDAQKVLSEIACIDKDDYNNIFNSHNYGGSNVSGQVHGEHVTIVQGPYYVSGQAPSTSSSILLQPSTENWQEKLETIQSSLRRIYSKSYRSVIQFSAPFFFDVEDKWVDLTLKLENDSSEDYADLLKKAFAKADMLIIEGDPENQQNKGMQLANIIWDICMNWGKVFLNLMKKLSSGTQKQQNKETHMANITLEICMNLGKVFLNLMKKLSSGTQKQLNKAMQVARIVWDVCMNLGKVFLNQTKKLSNGTQNQRNKETQIANITLEICMNLGKVFLNHTKTLSNGTQNQQNKVMLLRKKTWDICMNLGKVFLNHTKTLSNGTQNQQNKVMQMRKLTWDVCIITGKV